MRKEERARSAEAKRLESEQEASELADRLAANPEQYAIAANHDQNKELEQEGGEGR